jgi:hypothetical protein
MNTQNIFEDEWRACLRAHLFHVIKERDTGNEDSLITVLLQTGFTDGEIAEMRAEALAELGWDTSGDADSAIEPEYDGVPENELHVETEAVIAAKPDALMESEAAALESVAEPDDDEPEGPPVQLSLF